MQLRRLQLLQHFYNTEYDSGQEVGKKREFHSASSNALLAIILVKKYLLTKIMRKLYTS